MDGARGRGPIESELGEDLNRARRMPAGSMQVPALDTGFPPPPCKPANAPAKLIRQPRGAGSQGAGGQPVMQNFQNATALDNGLMDEDIDGAGSIPSLRPLRLS